MSQSCPLCGKTKSEEALFCDDCTKKIHTEYEVNIPEEINTEDTRLPEDLPVHEQPDDRFTDSPLSHEKLNNQDNTGLKGVVDTKESEPEAKADEVEMKAETGVKPQKKEVEVESKPELEPEPEIVSEPEKTMPRFMNSL